MVGMVTPAIIGWNIVSSSWRPRKYHGALDGFGVWLGLASSSSGALTKIEKKSRKAVIAEGGHELDQEQVGPGVDLVHGRGLDVLDGAGLDHGQQALGVAAGAGGGGGRRRRGGHRRAAAGRGRGRLGVAARGPVPGRLRPLEQLGGDAAVAAARVGARRAPPSPPPRAASALARASSARLRRCSGISTMGLSRSYRGPLMPPSLRTRQKCTAMKMTITKGRNSTCSTYHRNNVSEPISAPAQQGELHL